ncbi:hypothetical protein TcWFU_000001 [Taenia crassiceps]|uniref:Uncharacterized protein n=1 Tax=Taenia crassiceps TaxID=6207 RepID=A0ABR4QMN9_9CEST
MVYPLFYFRNDEKTLITTQSNASYTVLSKTTKRVKQSAIVSVADLGGTEEDYTTFLSLPAMKSLLTRCQWIVIILPGQDEGAADLEDCRTSAIKGNNSGATFMPKFSDMALDILEILIKLRLTRVVLFGEGLGANMLARVACLDDTIVLGAVFIHCCGVFLGPLASVRTKMQQWRAQNLPIEPYTEGQIIDHRFKSLNMENHSLNLKKAVSEFKHRVHAKLNIKNIKKLSVVYEQRISLTEQISHLNCPILFMAGKQSASLNRHRLLVEAVKKIHAKDKVNIESIEYNDTVNPLVEKPEKVAESLKYFLQGLGLVSCLTSSGASRGLKLPMASLPDEEGSSSGGGGRDDDINEVGENRLGTGDRRYSPPLTRQQKRVVPPFVWRQMSMAELDMPRGPAAFSSAKPPTS